MQVKNSILLLTALAAGSAVARLHGHERRHQHEERQVGAWVTAEIDGKVVSWQNTWAGPTDAPAAPAPAVTAGVADFVAAPAAKSSATSATFATSVSSSSAPAATGFGGVTAPTGSGDTYCGNVGSPYGSNIIEISEGDLNSYQYTITLDGSNIPEDYQVVFWNKCGADLTLTGFFASTFPLNVKVSKGSKSYVAVDTDSQGGFIGIPASQDIPRNSYGSILGFWGEFDFADSNNYFWSGFDVSAIQAQNAGQPNFPGLSITGAGQTSSITSNLGTVSNAYTSDLAEAGGIGGNVAPGPVSLTAILNYSG